MSKQEIVNEIITREWFEIQDAWGSESDAREYLMGLTKKELKKMFLYL